MMELLIEKKRTKTKLSRQLLDGFEVDYEKAFAQFVMCDDAKRSLIAAVDDEWGTAELQPLIWGKIKYVTPIPTAGDPKSHNRELGQSEKIANMLFEAGYVYLSDLFKATPNEVVEKGSNIGASGIEDIAWSIVNFHRHSEFMAEFMDVVVPTSQEFRLFVADLGRGHYGTENTLTNSSPEELGELFESHMRSLDEGELQWRVSGWDE